MREHRPHRLTPRSLPNLGCREPGLVLHQAEWVTLFLEVMPFWIVPLMVLLHEPATRRWSLTRRSSALSKRDMALIAGGVALLGAVPYSEELVRCLRR
jgi:hypothetical protein